MGPEDIEKLFEDARRRLDDIHANAVRDMKRVLSSLQAAVSRGNSRVDMDVKTKDTHRLATSRGKGPQDAHAPVLEAAGLTAGDAAKRAGWSEVVYSRCRNGLFPVPEKRALAIQEVTRSEKHPRGIEPTAAFWPAGVRVVKK